MKKKLLLLLFFTALKCIAQNGPTYLFGKIYDDLGTLPNAHIINLTTNKATYSNDNGAFKIKATLKDSLKITSIGFKTLIFSIKNTHFGISENKFILEKEIYELDEVAIKKHNLTGSLTSDLKQTPKDKKAAALAKTMDFSIVNMKAKTKDDYIDKRVRPPIAKTDPIIPGAGTKANMPFKHSERLWALRRELAFKNSLPSKLLSDFGEAFFFKELKIPKNKYHHFLEYCIPLGIEKLYQEDNLLAVIKILRKEHTGYLKLIKKE